MLQSPFPWSCEQVSQMKLDYCRKVRIPRSKGRHGLRGLSKTTSKSNKPSNIPFVQVIVRRVQCARLREWEGRGKETVGNVTILRHHFLYKIPWLVKGWRWCTLGGEFGTAVVLGFPQKWWAREGQWRFPILSWCRSFDSIWFASIAKAY